MMVLRRSMRHYYLSHIAIKQSAAYKKLNSDPIHASVCKIIFRFFISFPLIWG